MDKEIRRVGKGDAQTELKLKTGSISSTSSGQLVPDWESDWKGGSMLEVVQRTSAQHNDIVLLCNLFHGEGGVVVVVFGWETAKGRKRENSRSRRDGEVVAGQLLFCSGGVESGGVWEASVRCGDRLSPLSPPSR